MHYTNHSICFESTSTKTDSIMLTKKDSKEIPNDFHVAHCVGSVVGRSLNGCRQKPQPLFLSVLGRGGPMMLCTLGDLKNIYSDLDKVRFVTSSNR